MPPKTDKSKRQVCRSALHLHFAACYTRWLHVSIRYLNTLYHVHYVSTVKPLYSEQSRDLTICSLYRGVHPGGAVYVHVYMCLKYTVHILKPFRSCYGTHQVAEPFSMTVFFFYILCFFGFFIHVFLIVYHSSSIHSPRITHYDCNLQTDWNFANYIKALQS